jgi:hypothetical protein
MQTEPQEAADVCIIVLSEILGRLIYKHIYLHPLTGFNKVNGPIIVITIPKEVSSLTLCEWVSEAHYSYDQCQLSNRNCTKPQVWHFLSDTLVTGMTSVVGPGSCNFFTKGMTGQVMGYILDASYFDRFLVELVFIWWAWIESGGLKMST